MPSRRSCQRHCLFSRPTYIQGQLEVTRYSRYTLTNSKSELQIQVFTDTDTTVTRMSYRIPSELSKEILNYLTDDKKALKACSLANRNLTALSQQLFFSRVVIHTQPNPANPESTQLQTLACDLGGSPLKFRALLDTSPHIADYIECLQMINIGPFSDNQLDMYNNSLPHCLPHINKLKALVICGLHRWDDSSQETWSSILPLFQLPSLIHLDLSAIPGRLLDGTLGPNIKHLCVRHDTDFDQQFSSVPRPPISPPIYLDSLMIHRSDRNPRQEEFSRIKVGRLRKLVVREVWCDFEGPGTRSLLELCRDFLEELTIIPQLDGTLLS